MYQFNRMANTNSNIETLPAMRNRTTMFRLFFLLLFSLSFCETIAQRVPTQQQLERLLEQNSNADLNKDGKLTELEFKTFRKQQRRAELVGEAPPESKFDFPVEFTRAIMSDGVKIALAVGFPKGYNSNDKPKQWPAILRVSGYPGASIPDPPSLYGEKYVMVRASVRGTGASGGKVQPIGQQNSKDGYEIIENWIVKQAWSNGKVGITGHSWGGITGFMIATTNPPSLKAVAVSGLTDDLYRGMCRIGGIRNSGFLVNWSNSMYRQPGGPFGADQFAKQVRGMSEEDFQDVLAARPDRDLAKDQLWIQLQHPFDDAAWRELSPGDNAQNISAPTHIGHAFQDEQSGPAGLWLWKMLREDVPKRLVLSNGKHATPGHFNDDRNAWLDYWLCGENSNGIADPEQPPPQRLCR